jgi:hypothetical protein
LVLIQVAVSELKRPLPYKAVSKLKRLKIHKFRTAGGGGAG